MLLQLQLELQRCLPPLQQLKILVRVTVSPSSVPRQAPHPKPQLLDPRLLMEHAVPPTMEMSAGVGLKARAARCTGSAAILQRTAVKAAKADPAAKRPSCLLLDHHLLRRTLTQDHTRLSVNQVFQPCTQH